MERVITTVGAAIVKKDISSNNHLVILLGQTGVLIASAAVMVSIATKDLMKGLEG